MLARTPHVHKTIGSSRHNLARMTHADLNCCVA
jgi:hypothetical protein